jgi:hypothetical protein
MFGKIYFFNENSIPEKSFDFYFQPPLVKQRVCVSSLTLLELSDLAHKMASGGGVKEQDRLM